MTGHEKHFPWPWLSAALIVLVSPSRTSAQIERESSCVVCHSRINAEYQPSVHALNGMTCVDCHGGDPTDMEPTSMGHQAGFKGRISRAQVPPHCASCHAKIELMKPYGLPTDQYQEYQTSEHGQALAQGNPEAAVCTDCHQAHRILPASDPRSSVAPLHLPRTCAPPGACHADGVLMAKYNLPTGQYEKFINSVHGQALRNGRSAAAPTCASCHGSHGAVPPGVKNIEHVCGKCHRTTEQAFRRSPHQEAVEQGKFRPCTACHEHHRTSIPSGQQITDLCVKCHAPDSSAAAVGEDLQGLIIKAQETFMEAQREVRQAQLEGFAVQEMEGYLAEAYTHLEQVAVTQHSLLQRAVERHIFIADATAQDVRERIHHLYEERREQQLGLVLVWLFIGLAVFCLWLKRRRVVRRLLEGREGEGRGGKGTEGTEKGRGREAEAPGHPDTHSATLGTSEEEEGF